MKKSKTAKWSPAVAVRRPDNIVSSKARAAGDKGFIPSYENVRFKEPKINMNFIMSNEYLRIWLKERATYEVDTYSKVEADLGPSANIKRKYVTRLLNKERIKRQEMVLPPIKLKRFANVKSKTDATKPKAMKDEKKEKEQPAT